MSAKTKIVVLHRKELIYTVLFAALAILILISMVILFMPDAKTTDAPTDTTAPATERPATESERSTVQVNAAVGTYIPGIYTTELVLNGQTVDVEVIVSQESISSIRLTNANEAVTTMYPLLEPTLDAISDQIYETQSLSNITYSADSKYTSLILLEAIRNSLAKASS
ncbi:MAG: hypothetical protein IJ147_13765 [Lachnospiraceae bacterium]|nr:hypothetical protein [Lachnospiraceae bacterium]MBQ8119104.1 hypothetical protein [Lachnospiraceae bacterium]